MGLESRFPDRQPPPPTQARVHSAEPCCPFSFPNTTWELWRVLWTCSTLMRLHAFAPAVPPAWHVLPGRTLPSKLPPPSRGSGSIPPGRLTQIAGPGWWVNFWYLLHCEIYVSACSFDSRLPEAKIPSCSSLYPSSLHRAGHGMSFPSM